MDEIEKKLEIEPTGEGEGAPSDRDGVARFVSARREQIRALARQRLSVRMRNLYDSEDVYSSVARAMDELAARELLRPANEAELWGLIATITRNNAITKVRLAARARALFEEDGAYTRELIRRTEACQSDGDSIALCLHMMMALEKSADRSLFALRLRGASHKVAADALGIDEATCRQRWKAIRDRLAQMFKEQIDA